MNNGVICHKCIFAYQPQVRHICAINVKKAPVFFIAGCRLSGNDLSHALREYDVD